MPLSNEVSIYQTARKVLDEAITKALGSANNAVITFHLKQKFGKDPSEVFVENPRAFFVALQSIFGAGAESIVSLIGTFLITRYGMAYSTGEFLELLKVGDRSSRDKLEEILSKIASEKEN